ncbi:hypothetical protein LCGC14_2840630, partial [marine sediment metagenome]
RQQSMTVAYRPQGIALQIAAVNIFTLSGGPILIEGFFALAENAIGAASTYQVTACGVVMENAAVACNLLVGEMALWPLTGVAGGDVIVPNIAAGPYPPLASNLLGMQQLLLAPGSAGGDNFVLTVGAAITPANTVVFYCLYRKMRPESLLTPV